MRTDDEACAIEQIRILDDNILLLFDNPDFDPMLAPTTDFGGLVIGCVIWLWQTPLK